MKEGHKRAPKVPHSAEDRLLLGSDQGETYAFLAHTADGVCVTDPEGRVRFWNRAAESILEYLAQEVVGRPCHEIFCGCDANGNRICGITCPIRTLLHARELVQHFHMATRTRTGNPLWIDVSYVCIPSRNQRPPTIINLFRDVTAAHQIELFVRQRLAQRQLAASEKALNLNGELTRRELQVMTLLRNGATTDTIAEKLFISRVTVRNHIQNIFSKLNVHTRLEAVAYLNQLAQRGSRPNGKSGTEIGDTLFPNSSEAY